mmetsp:Transcript_109111/g.303435  ORF Transcript_109111/g.303435 Transcript_109111/m.303435 type:complete len:281 (-) Transcript_109111:196-1038(-)
MTSRSSCSSGFSWKRKTKAPCLTSTGGLSPEAGFRTSPGPTHATSFAPQLRGSGHGAALQRPSRASEKAGPDHAWGAPKDRPEPWQRAFAESTSPRSLRQRKPPSATRAAAGDVVAKYPQAVVDVAPGSDGCTHASVVACSGMLQAARCAGSTATAGEILPSAFAPTARRAAAHGPMPSTAYDDLSKSTFTLTPSTSTRAKLLRDAGKLAAAAGASKARSGDSDRGGITARVGMTVTPAAANFALISAGSVRNPLPKAPTCAMCAARVASKSTLTLEKPA